MPYLDGYWSRCSLMWCECCSEQRDQPQNKVKTKATPTTKKEEGQRPDFRTMQYAKLIQADGDLINTPSGLVQVTLPSSIPSLIFNALQLSLSFVFFRFVRGWDSINIVLVNK